MSNVTKKKKELALTNITLLLGAFAEMRKPSISFVRSARPSVRIEQLGSNWADFHEIDYLRIFRKSAEGFQDTNKML